LFYLLNQSEYYSHVRRYIPKPIRHLATRLTSKKYSATRPTWSESDRDWFQKTYRQVTTDFFRKTETKDPDWSW